MSEVLVSIIIAVFNREDLLDRCLETVINQTYKNFEVILVDDFSEDESYTKCLWWRDSFPNIVRVYKNEKKGVANAKNFGIKMAKGKYIAFIDSDDYVNYDYIETLVKPIECDEDCDCEIVFSPIYKEEANQLKIIGSFHNPSPTVKEVLDNDYFFLHGKLIACELFKRFGLLPNLSIGEDSSWLYVFFSFSKNRAYVQKAGYYYIYSPNSVSIQNDKSLVEDAIKGAEYVIDRCNTEYQGEALYYSLKRLYNFKTKFIGFEKIIDESLLNWLPFYTKYEIAYSRGKWLTKKLSKEYRSKPQIPKRVYINGFEENNIQLLEANARKIFGIETEIIFLNETTCDITRTPYLVEAYRNGKFVFLSQYLAVEEIYKNGGVYIDSRICVDRDFNGLINCGAFFIFENDDLFSGSIFGGVKGNFYFKAILQSYNMTLLYPHFYNDVSERIRTVIIGNTNIWMKAKYRDMSENLDVVLYGPEMFVLGLSNTEGQDPYSHYYIYDENLRKYISEVVNNAIANNYSKISTVRKQNEALKAMNNRLKNENIKLRGELNQVYISKSWKITEPFRRVLFSLISRNNR